MAHPSSQKMILTACQLAFTGKKLRDIAAMFDVSPSKITRWRKTELWQEFEAELVATEKAQVLKEHREQTLESAS